jgi:hypothetical protein
MRTSQEIDELLAETLKERAEAIRELTPHVELIERIALRYPSGEGVGQLIARCLHFAAAEIRLEDAKRQIRELPE